MSDFFISVDETFALPSEIMDANFGPYATVEEIDAADVGAATAAQGATADTAVQPGDTGTTTTFTYATAADARPTGVDRVIWLPADPALDDPTNATVDDVVLRATPGVGSVYVWDGDSYEATGGRTFIGPGEPSGVSPANGDRWIDTDDGVLYAWWDTEWVVVGGEAPAATAPGQVTGLTATAGDGEVDLSWSAPATGGSPITSYVVERADDETGSPGSYSSIGSATAPATTYNDNTVTNGSTYWYRVSAVNAIGTGTASDPDSATPTGGAPPVGPEVIAAEAMAYTTTDSPVVSLPSYTPVENDIVFAFIGNASVVTATPPAGWLSVIPNPYIAIPGDTTVAGLCLYHVVTAGEETAVTNSWTLTSLFSVTEIGEIIAVVVRPADTTTVVDDHAIYANETTSVTHVLPGLEGDNLSDNSLVLAATFPDGLQTYTTPAGWSLVETTTGTNLGGAVFQLDTLTEVGVDIPPTNVTASALDEAVGITVAILAAP